MYISLNQLAVYLGVTESYLRGQLLLGNISGVFDGKTWLFNQSQFDIHKKQLDDKRKQAVKDDEEPIPEDWDAHDED